MEQIVFKYLDKQYKLTLSTYVSFKVLDKIENTQVTLKSVLQNLKIIFNIDEIELMNIFDKWADGQAGNLNKEIRGIADKLNEEVGFEVQLTDNDLKHVITSEYPNLEAVLNKIHGDDNNA